MTEFQVEMGMIRGMIDMVLKNIAFALVIGGIVTGCATAPANPLLPVNGENSVMNQVMKRNDRIVQVSSEKTTGDKPVLLLLHGATDDPTEMMDIVREWRGKYTVLLYSYNYHRRVEKVAADFVNEVKRIESENSLCRSATVVVYSYSAIVFREAVIIADDRSLFSDMSLIQLVPTAGGSRQARSLKNPVAVWLVSLFSKPSRAENPNGSFARQIWDGNGNRKFWEVINPERVHTILLEDDANSLSLSTDKKIHERYENGIGQNVEVIPKSAGVTHDYFPTNPVALGYLRTFLEPPHDLRKPQTVGSVARK